MQAEKVQALPRGEIIATGVSVEDYMEHYAADFAEWVNGVVIKMLPVSKRHNDLTRFLEDVFSALFPLIGGGEVLQAPMVMVTQPESKRREPNLQVFLPENAGKIKDTYAESAADLVVEIISPESTERDRGEKFTEYEQSGVKEYWIIDPTRKEALFYALREGGVYDPRNPDFNGIYTSAVLPRLRLPVALLWRDPLPSIYETIRLVEAMLTEGSG